MGYERQKLWTQGPYQCLGLLYYTSMFSSAPQLRVRAKVACFIGLQIFLLLMEFLVKVFSCCPSTLRRQYGPCKCQPGILHYVSTPYPPTPQTQHTTCITTPRGGRVPTSVSPTYVIQLPKRRSHRAMKHTCSTHHRCSVRISSP